MDSFEKFFEDKLPDKFEFFSSLKDVSTKKIMLKLLVFGMFLK